jgi:hypothetical protein
VSTGEVPRLALSEWLVMCAVCEQSTHGFAKGRTSNPAVLATWTGSLGGANSLAKSPESDGDLSPPWWQD